MPFSNRIFFKEDLFSSDLSQLKKYHNSRNLQFINLGIFHSFKFRFSKGKVLSISHKLNFTPNTLGCYGLTHLFISRGSGGRQTWVKA